MKKILDKIVRFFDSYLLCLEVFVVLAAVVLIVNICLVSDYGNWNILTISLSVICYILECFGVGLVFMPLGAVARLVGKKASFWFSSLFFSILTVSEIGMTVYSCHNGMLLGAELIERPVSESLAAVFGAVGYVIPVVGVVGIILIFTLSCFFLWRRQRKVVVGYITLITVLLSAPLSYAINLYVENNRSQNVESVVALTPKTSYFLKETYHKLREQHGGSQSGFEYKPSAVADFINLNDYLGPIDNQYPLERYDTVPDSICRYFSKSEVQPDIVVILVESLGKEFIGLGAMPFIDSLAANSLYWPHCISTTSRSFGAMAAVSGSLVGPKGFQFGTMPEHNSLFSILKKAGYATNSFYSGYYTFDCIYEYLVAQHIDYMSPYYDEMKRLKNDSLGTWWGYHDAVLLERTLDDIESMHDERPQFNFITTISMHEDLQMKDQSVVETCLRNVDAAAEKVSGEDHERMTRQRKRYASANYTDRCLSDFMREYSRLHRFENTIFVITGDHASGISISDPLDYYEVPVIVWSPMLNSTATLPSVVTHLDIAPSLSRLLHRNYNVPVTETVHWFGKGLDFSPSMEFDRRLLFINADRTLNQMLCGRYFYSAPTASSMEKIYCIDDKLQLAEIDNPEIMAECRRQIELYKYIYNYTYYSDKLTKHPVFDMSDIKQVMDKHVDKEIVCSVPDKMPSEGGRNIYNILENTDLKNIDGFRTAELTLEADVTVLKSLEMDQYADLVFDIAFNSTGLWAGDKVPKFLPVDEPCVDMTYHLSLTKQFELDHNGKNIVSIYLATPEYDDRWVPGEQLIFKNMNVTISYMK